MFNNLSHKTDKAFAQTQDTNLNILESQDGKELDLKNELSLINGGVAVDNMPKMTTHKLKQGNNPKYLIL